MCPVLRGELPPVPPNELTRLRDELERSWGHAAHPTPSGPLLVVRIPEARPDLLRDLEAATDQLPPIDLTGYRGAVLVGDRGQLFVSIEMVHSLVDARRGTEARWVAHHREGLADWGFTVTRLPSDAARRLRAVIRVGVGCVGDMEEKDFDRLAALLADIKTKSPGQCRPEFAYLVAHEDHVRIDGARFFSELEARARRTRERKDREVRRKREASYELARGHLARLEERRSREGRRPLDWRPGTKRHRRELGDPPVTRPERPSRPSTRSTGHDSRPVRRSRLDAPGPPRTAPRSTSHATSAARRPDLQIPRPDEKPAPDPRFQAADAHPDAVALLRKVLQEAGYETRERLVVDDLPLALAAARPEGYPRRVLVMFAERLEADEARRLLRVARGAGSELALAVADATGEGVERVTLATNLKVIAPEAVATLRLD